MVLPQFNSDSKDLAMLQNTWASQLDPIIGLPIVKGLILPSVSLVSGTNEVNHRLGRKLQGWWIVRQRAAASIYDQQDSEMNPSLMLKLISTANVLVDLFVF